MEKVLVIKDSVNGELFAVVTEKNGSLRAYGSNKPGKQWAMWLDETHRGRGRLDSIAKRLPLGLSTDGPKSMTRKVRSELSAILPKITENAREEIATGRVESKSLIIQLGQKPPASRARIQRGNQKDWNAQVNYKALAFVNDANLAALSYEIKRTRAVFDPDLGPNGGFRCPVGTRYGGQITDRFGRGCGFGVARRLLNTVVDAGERAEGALDRRRDRRVQRRNRRVGQRLGKPVSSRTGRLERAARGADRFAGRARAFANRMDGNPGQPRRRDRVDGTITGGRIDRAGQAADRFAGRARRFADRMDGRDRRRSAAVEQANSVPRQPRRATTPVGEVQRSVESNRPAKKAAAKKAPAKKRVVKKQGVKKQAAKKAAAKKAPAKKAAAKKAPARRPPSETPAESTSRLTQLRRDLDQQVAAVAHAGERDALIDEWRRRQFQIDNLAAAVPEENVEGLERESDIYGQAIQDLGARNLPPAPAPAKKATAKKATAKKAPAKKAAAKKAPAKKATAMRPSTARPEWDPLAFDRLDKEEREFVRDFLQNAGFFTDPDRERQWRDNAVENFGPDALDERARSLENAARDDRLKAQDEDRSLRDRIAYNELANRREERAEELRRRAEIKRTQRGNAAESQRQPEGEAQRAPANPPSPPSDPKLADLDTADRERAQSLIDASLGFDPSELNRRVADRIARRDRSEIENRIAALNRSVNSDRQRLEGRDADDLFNRVVDNELIKRRQAMVRRYEQALRDIPDPNAPLPPLPELPEERKAELEMEVADRYARLREKRGAILGKYLKKRYGDGNPPPWKTDRNLSVDEVRRLAAGDADDRRKVKEWILQIYNHDEIEVRGGQKFRTARVRVDVRRSGGEVSGDIEAFNEAENRWEKVGGFARTLKWAPGSPAFVENDRMMMGKEAGLDNPFANAAKNSGWTSVFNPHAFMWLKASGFEYAKVSAAYDGRFVWGKAGFRQEEARVRNVVRKMTDEVRKYRNGDASIIRTDLDADLVQYLARVSEAANYQIDAPQHPEFILALRGPENMSPSGRKAYDEQIKTWFTDNAPFGTGRFDFDDENVPDDPRDLA